MKDITRWFGLSLENHPTHVEVFEKSDGNYLLSIVTRKTNKEDMITSMNLCPRTIALLSDVLFSVAHDPSVWKEFKYKDKENDPSL